MVIGFQPQTKLVSKDRSAYHCFKEKGKFRIFSAGFAPFVTFFT